MTVAPAPAADGPPLVATTTGGPVRAAPMRKTTSPATMHDLSAFARSAVVLAALLSAACTPAAETVAQTASGSRANSAVPEEWQTSLLDGPAAAAGRMPANPHLKNRSKVQEELAAALLELGAIDAALRCAEAIGNWRQGCVWADAAYECALQGREQQALQLLEKAHKVAESAGDGEIQDWQRGRVRGKIARAYLALGRESAAKPYMQNLEPAEAKAVADELARQAPLEHFEPQRAALEDGLASGDFERIKTAIDLAVLVHARWYDEQADREAVEELLERHSQRLPLDIRVGALLRMCDTAATKGVKGDAMRLMDKARALVDGAKWLPEHRIPLDARIAELLHRAGDTQGAAALLDSALERYAAEEAQIVNIYRAGALRPVAEVLRRTGRDEAALDTYRRVLEAGMANPNSRPRLDDLAATCISLARTGCKPDAALRARIDEIAKGLGDPW